jgi:DNA-directed RNA polymerase I subunit RPA2
MTVKLCWKVDQPGQTVRSVTKDGGLIPIMVRVGVSLLYLLYPRLDDDVQSVRCNLRSMPSAGLVRHHEEPEEFGGYFIVNGNERLIRYLILPRRNHVIALTRPSFQNRGPSYTPYAVQIRCVRPDQTSVTNTLHYLANGSAMLRFSWRKQEYVVPIMLLLKALVGASDREIFEGVIMQDYENTFLIDRAELLLRSYKIYSLHTSAQCLDYLGDKFRIVLGLPEDWTNLDVGTWLIRRVVLVHLETPRDKFRILLCAETALVVELPLTTCGP